MDLLFPKESSKNSHEYTYIYFLFKNNGTIILVEIYTPKDHAVPPFAGRTDPPSVSVDCSSCICPPFLSSTYHVPPSSRPFLSLYMTVACGPPLQLCPPPAEGPASQTQQVFFPSPIQHNSAQNQVSWTRKILHDIAHALFSVFILCVFVRGWVAGPALLL